MTNIQETLGKIKPLYPILLIIVLASIFFGLGRLSARKNDSNPIHFEEPGLNQAGNVISGVVATTSISSRQTSSQSSVKQIAAPKPSGEVIGSKSGKKYYFPWCGTVKRIKSENQVHFASIADAKAAGFVAGGNCKGLE